MILIRLKSEVHEILLLLIFIQAALVIRGLGIRGFDYSRIRYQGKTANNEGINTILVYFEAKMWVLVFADRNFSRNVTPANNEGNLYVK